MPENSFLYCDVAVPVPLDRPFTYSLPETLRHRVKPGCRVIVPFGPRKLTGVVLRCHDEAPDAPLRDALRLIDAEPALDESLISLGRWIAQYYCAPLGDVLRGMLPLAADIHSGKLYTLTPAGRDAARQLLLGSAPDDPAMALLRALESRPLSAAYLKKKLPLADKALKALERRGFIAAEAVREERDPLRSPAQRLRIELSEPRPEGKFSKAERELLAFLELHPGSHNLRDLEGLVRNASPAARSLARRGNVKLSPDTPGIDAGPVRARHNLNPDQQCAFDQLREAIGQKQFRTFLLHGVTGSGKTEVYLRAIEATLEAGRSALMLVPRNRPHSGGRRAVLHALRGPCRHPAQRVHR